MSVEKLKRANHLKEKISQLEANKKSLSWLLSSSVVERDMVIEGHANGTEPIQIAFKSGKTVALLLNQENEKQLESAQSEFASLFAA